VEGTMVYFNKIYKLLWVFLIFLIMYLSFQRNIKSNGEHQEVVSAFSSAPILSTFTIILIIVLTGISILRAIESRNEWRKIAEEDNTNKVFDKIEDKKNRIPHK